MITPYWMMISLGAVASVLFIWFKHKQLNLTSMQSILFAILIAAAGVPEGMLLYAVLHWEELIYDGAFPIGLTIFGPIFLDALSAPFFGRIFGLKRHQSQDIYAPCVAIFIGFLSIGCYFTGCCGGHVTTMFGYALRWPAQATSSICCFLIFAILLEKAETGKYEGQLYPLFLMYYGTYRFLDEFLRTSEKDLLFLSIWQWLSIAAILIGFLWKKQVKEKRNATH